MKICILRSGSSGNCTLIENNKSYFLLDAGGMSQRRIKELLSEVNITLEDIKGLLVTHTHSDHLNYSALKVCEKSNIPVYIHAENIPFVKSSFGTALFSKLEIIPFEQTPFMINETIQIFPFNISHDAMKVTSGFSFMESTGNVFSYAADLGYFPESLVNNFRNSKIIAIEANHDVDLLWKNPNRPYIHKKRVAGDYGHLSNNQSADAICKIVEQSQTSPEKVILCHLSKDHNSPELAKETISGILEKRGMKLQILVAKRDERTVFFDL